MFTGPIDGRRQRGHRSRERIVAAMLALVEAGDVTPGAEQVAAKAGVGLRTVFRHFRDMESLYAEMGIEVSKRFEAMAAPFEREDWAGQLAEMCERRWTTYEALMPFKRASDVHRHESKLLQANFLAVLAVMRSRLETVLPAEIVEDSIRFEAVDLLLSYAVWQRLRVEQGLESEGARGLLRHQIEVVLGGKSGESFGTAYAERLMRRWHEEN